jgi:hypothetical protein
VLLITCLSSSVRRSRSTEAGPSLQGESFFLLGVAMRQASQAVLLPKKIIATVKTSCNHTLCRQNTSAHFAVTHSNSCKSPCFKCPQHDATSSAFLAMHVVKTFSLHPSARGFSEPKWTKAKILHLRLLLEIRAQRPWRHTTWNNCRHLM